MIGNAIVKGYGCCSVPKLATVQIMLLTIFSRNFPRRALRTSGVDAAGLVLPIPEKTIVSQHKTMGWKTVTVLQSQALGRPDGRVSIGFWTKELGAIAFEVDQQAIDVLREHLVTAEKLLHQKAGRA